MIEQRNYRRVSFHSEADISFDGNVYRCDLVDLALQGALFQSETKLPLVLGNQASLHIYLPDSPLRMEFVAKLVHQHGEFYGFVFVAEEVETMGHLRRLLELNFGNAAQAEEEFRHWLKGDSAG